MSPNKTCNVCSEVFASAAELDQHKQDLKPCTICNECIPKEDRRNHARVHQLDTTLNINGHIIVVHKDARSGAWPCPWCDSAYAQTIKLRRHVVAKHEAELPTSKVVDDAAKSDEESEAVGQPDDVDDMLKAFDEQLDSVRAEQAEKVAGTENRADLTPWLERNHANEILKGVSLSGLLPKAKKTEDHPTIATLRQGVSDLWAWGWAVYHGNGTDEDDNPIAGIKGHTLDRALKANTAIPPPGGHSFMVENPANYATQLRNILTITFNALQASSQSQSTSETIVSARYFDPKFTPDQVTAWNALVQEAERPTPAICGPTRLSLRLIDWVTSLIEAHVPKQPLDSALTRTSTLVSVDFVRGVFCQPQYVSSKLAGLLWGYRFCWIVKQLYDSRHREDWLQVMDDIERRRQRMLVEGTPFPLAELISQLYYASRISFNSSGKPKFSWSRDGETVIYAGTHEINMEALRAFIRELIVSTRCFFAERLFHTTNEDLPPVHLLQIKDDLYYEGSRQSYSFAEEPANQDLWDRSWLLKHMLRDRELRQAIWDESTKIWKRSGVNEWMIRVEQGLGKLAALLLWTGGQAPRSTELVTVRMENTVADTRDFFVDRGQVFYTTTYNKSQRRTGNSMVIPRALPTAVGELVALWMIYIRRAQALLTQAVQQSLLSHSLFVDRQQRMWDAKRLSKPILSITKANLKADLTYRDIRQLLVAIADQHLRWKPKLHGNGEMEDAEAEEDDGLGIDEETRRPKQDAIALQAGHTERTGKMHYGLSIDQLLKLNPDSNSTIP